MDTLQNMRAFTSVAEAGSFTAAAAMLDTTTANVSRAVSNLEAHLQTRLLNRTTRRIALTEAGKRYLLRCGYWAATRCHRGGYDFTVPALWQSRTQGRMDASSLFMKLFGANHWSFSE